MEYVNLGSSSLSQIRKLALILIILLILHIISMGVFENMNVIDSIWLTLTTATTVGFGDNIPKTIMGRLSTIFFIYLSGIVTAAQIGVLYFEYLVERRMKILQGKWSWKKKGHIVFLNAPSEGADEYFKLAIENLRNSKFYTANLPVIIHSDCFSNGLSEELRKSNVTHVHSESITKDSLKRASIESAAIIIIMAKHRLEQSSDSISFDLIHRIRNMGIKAQIIVECVQIDNKERLSDAGANNVIRPIRSYPELMIRSIVSPGIEQIIEELISHRGANCVRYDVAVSGSWKLLQNIFIEHNLGALIGYIDANGVQHLSPRNDEVIEIYGLIVISNSEQISSVEEILIIIEKHLIKEEVEHDNAN
jgi:voltage-gated potassium channel